MTSILQKPHVVIDLSELPLHGKRSASLTWWGTLGFMLIEGSGFALVLAVYLYLASIATEWPIGAPPPDLLPGTIITVLLLLSLIPNMLVSRWARQEDLRKVRIGLIVMALLRPLVVRRAAQSGVIQAHGAAR